MTQSFLLGVLGGATFFFGDWVYREWNRRRGARRIAKILAEIHSKDKNG